MSPEVPKTEVRNDQPQPPRFQAASLTERNAAMYGHSHTGIGSLVLTFVASAKGGISYLVRILAHAQQPH
jgi:hypothetical protein